MSVAKIELTTPEGAPVQVETGVGRITALIEKGTRNVQVHIDAEHLREPVTGWVDKQGPMWPRVQWAKANDVKIWYRVDLKRHRKATEPIQTPLGQLERNSKTRDVVRIERPENAPLDDTIGLDPMVNQPTGRADGGGVGQSSVGQAPTATATDGHAPQGPRTPAAARPPAQQQPVTHPPTQSAGHQAAKPSPNPSPRPQSAPPVPGPALTAQMLEALRDVVQAVHVHAEESWVNDCADAAVASGCSPQQVLHVLDRARRELDVGLPTHPTATQPSQGRQQPQERAQQQPRQQDPMGDVAARAVQRQRDPDGLQSPVRPADVSEPGAQPPAAPQSLVGAHNGMSRRVSPRGNVTADAAVYAMTNTDGSVNFGSYLARNVMKLVKTAAAQRMTRLRTLNQQDPDTHPLRIPTPREVDDLARTLLTMADRIQVHLRGGNRADRHGTSYDTAMTALYEAIAAHPIPWGQPTPVMVRWVEEAVAYGCMLVDVASGIVMRRPSLREQEESGDVTGAPDGQVPDGDGERR